MAFIRELQRDDVSACSNIVCDNWGIEVAKRFEDEVAHVWVHGMQWPPIYFVSVEGHEVVGFAGMIESWIMHGVWDFIWVNVRVDHQGGGIGRALTERRVEEVMLRGGSVIQLMTLHRKFFRKLGFRTSHELEGGWTHMIKQLRKLSING